MKHLFEGGSDFVKRYAAIVRAVWAERRILASPERTPEEIAFLPAHLELIETPVSPLARWTMRIIIAFFCLALLWACLGKVDIVAVAPGKIVVGSRTKVIQPAETAVITRIAVRDGQLVEKGALLIELDATEAVADVSKAGDALLNAQLAELRLVALSHALDSGKEPELRAGEGVPKDRLESERRLATSQFAAYQARQESLRAAIAQRRAEEKTVQALIGPLEETARIARMREDDYARLLDGRFVGRHEYLLRQQERIAAERDLASQRSRLQEVGSAMSGAREELKVHAAEVRQQTLDGLRQAREEMAQFAPEVDRARQRNTLMQLRAPVTGTVQQLAVHTVGGVVTPAQPLLAVVPSEETLEVEAMVLNKDIGFVRPGQRVTVKVESFPYTRYGFLEGAVETISHDAAQDEHLGLVFPARVRLKQAHLDVDGARIGLTPGMNLSAEIATGKRRVIDYLLSPIRQHKSEALKER